ncbi:MAG: ankyrin repeat domain-containing protein, partial [Alphaproteobacteria bacterium]|nr:ankyrin repeat domain-containing protein [Alphaproteobacteria bacterium]
MPNSLFCAMMNLISNQRLISHPMPIKTDNVNLLNDQFLLACENANIPMARDMVRQGANTEAVNTAGESALHLAVRSGNTWVVNYLLEELLL